MKREIILLRHAHAESAASADSDAERLLSPRGVAEAQAAAHWLCAQQTTPARVLCSPAARTRQTLEYALAEIGAVDTRFEPRVYEATAGELLSVLDEHDDVPCLLMVGHNPGMETLAALLATGQSGDFRGIPPAGIAWFELTGITEPGAGRLKAFWSP